MNEYFLGVDGGQSSTVAVIGDAAGRTIGWAASGPCNHVASSEARAKFLRVMRECLSNASARAEIDLATVRKIKPNCFMN
jgi:N-acetylglucosamine kinase-like BadF-type ATPase